MFTLQCSNKMVRGLAFSPDGRLLAVCCADQAVHLWDLATRQEREVFRRLNDRGFVVAFSPDGRSLALVTRRANPVDAGQRLILWDLVGNRVGWDALTCEMIPTVASPHRARIRDCLDLAFAPDGQSLFVLRQHYGGAVVCGYRLSPARETLTFPNSLGSGVPLSCLTYAPDGATLATGGPDGSVRLWDPTTGRQRAELLRRGRVRDIVYGPDGSSLALALDEAVLVWDLGGRRRVFPLGSHAVDVHVLAFAPDGQTVASAGDDGVVRWWSLGGKTERAAFDWRIGMVRALAFAPDGLTMAVGGETGTVVVWDTEDLCQGW